MFHFPEIRKYLLFLKHSCGLSISIHPFAEKERLLSRSDLLVFNIHDNSYCAFIKTDPRAIDHCLDCQGKVLQKCQEGKAFIGTCFAGVKELVYPFNNGSETVGFLSVTGYQAEQPDSYFKKLTETYSFSKNDLQRCYRTLNPHFPNKDEIDTLIAPLCDMLELAYRKSDCDEEQLPLSERIVQYINQNKNRDLTSDEICKRFFCSRSYMSTTFNKAVGKTLREYITELRMKDAKSLLKHSDLSVTEIALSVGYGSCAYFSEKFKELAGVTPIEYRKASRK